MAKRKPNDADIVTPSHGEVFDSPPRPEVTRFTTLSPMLASYDGDYISDPPCFDGRVPDDSLGFLPESPRSSVASKVTYLRQFSGEDNDHGKK